MMSFEIGFTQIMFYFRSMNNERMQLEVKRGKLSQVSQLSIGVGDN